MLQSKIKGGTKQRRGTLQDYLAEVNSDTNPCTCDQTPFDLALILYSDAIVFPKRSTGASLREWGPGIYGSVLLHLQSIWDVIQPIVSSVSTNTQNNAVNFMGDVVSYSHIFIKGVRYGAAAHHKGKSSKYAYIHGREAVEIQRIFQVSQVRSDPTNEPLTAVCVIVRRFQRDNNIPSFPWDLRCAFPAGIAIVNLMISRAADLGADVWYADLLGGNEVISVQYLTGNPIICPLEVGGQNYLITVAFNHVCITSISH